MKVPVLLAANAAQVTDNGLLNVAGGGWTNYDCGEFPGTVTGVIWGLLEVGSDERAAPPHARLTLEDHESNEIVALTQFRPTAPAGDGPVLLPFAVPFSFVAEDTMLAEFVLRSDDVELARLSIPIRGSS